MTGHTADDQAETVLINLIRGAGLWGLRGMEPGQRHPILGLRRADTEWVCAVMGFSPVYDESNDDGRFVRNRIRHEVLPLLDDIAGRDQIPLLTRTAEHARAVAADLDKLGNGIDPTDTRALQAEVTSVTVSVLRRWLRDELGHPPSAADLDRLLAVVHHEIIATEISGGRRVSRHKGKLWVEARHSGP